MNECCGGVCGDPQPGACFELNVGDKVTYHSHGKSEKGIVKEVPTHTRDSVRVVYHCDDQWEDYKNYTSALTRIADLEFGWHD